MQIGIDLGATKIESVLLDENGKEITRGRENSPKNYEDTLNLIRLIVESIEIKQNKKFRVGLCHPGSISKEDDLLFNSNNSPWMNKHPLQKDISKKLNRNVYCENDANCFTLSEAIDGSAKDFNCIFGVILGSGCGGGLVINKKIHKGSNYFAGEWGHNPLPYYGILDDENINLNKGVVMPNITIEKHISGSGIEYSFFEIYKKKLTAQEIFSREEEYKTFVNNFYSRLARSLSVIVNTIDPDAIVFGGGFSNEIKNFDLLKLMTGNFSGKGKINTSFIKALHGDASGVRGAARLGKKIEYLN